MAWILPEKHRQAADRIPPLIKARLSPAEVLARCEQHEQLMEMRSTFNHVAAMREAYWDLALKVLAGADADLPPELLAKAAATVAAATPRSEVLYKGTCAVYGDLVKSVRTAAGELEVTGKASGSDLDLDQQICDPVWLAQAMPAWFSSGANVREMHGGIAAGVGLDLSQDGNDWLLRALVVDPGTCRKVETGVLKGFSIGIRSPRVVTDATAPGGRIAGGQIVEVSLVDRPANPTCKIALTKGPR